MTQNLAEQLESAYARASMRENAKHLRSPQDWQRMQDIEQRRAHASQNEQQSFRQDYTSRVADAWDAILKERSQWHYTHPAPQSAARQDRFDKDQIERQAHLRVHNAHHQTMAKIDMQASKEVRELIQRNQPLPPTHTQTFNQAHTHAQLSQTAPYQQIRRTR
ncbi:MAG: hypothetical protein ABJO27_09910 [Pseudoruegeria sp.]